MARVILEAAGRPTELAPIVEAMRAMSAAVVLPFTVVLDRAMLDVTWSPHGMASRRARGENYCRFVRTNR